jgi:hypothetical protein
VDISLARPSTFPLLVSRKGWQNIMATCTSATRTRTATDAWEWFSAAALRRRFVEVFVLDLRSLAVFRIGLGMLLLADLAFRAGDLQAHYTDLGVLPRSAISAPFASSVHLLNGSVWFQAGLFVLAALFALALLVGFFTRLATFASCFLLISLHARNPVVLEGGDVLLRVLLFWSIFLPLGAVFSVDRLRSRVPRSNPRLVSMAAAALILQVCFVYWFAALLKTDASWRTDGTAIYYTLSIDQFSTRLGRSLLAYPELLRLLTFATLWLEALGPVLLFVPFGRGLPRLLVVAAFLIFHLLGLNLTLELGHFPYICAVAWLALLPSRFWDKLTSRMSLFPSNIQQLSFPVRTPAWMNALAAFFLVYVFLWNVRTVDFQRFHAILPQRLDWIGEGFGLSQMWSLFAPTPMKDAGWYVIVGDLENGRQVDLFREGRPVRWEKPELVSATYKNTRWRKYLLNLWQKSHAAHRMRYADYLCREWNSQHEGGEKLENIEIFFMLEVIRPDRPPDRPQAILICRTPSSRTKLTAAVKTAED